VEEEYGTTTPCLAMACKRSRILPMTPRQACQAVRLLVLACESVLDLCVAAPVGEGQPVGMGTANIRKAKCMAKVKTTVCTDMADKLRERTADLAGQAYLRSTAILDRAVLEGLDKEGMANTTSMDLCMGITVSRNLRCSHHRTVSKARRRGRLKVTGMGMDTGRVSSSIRTDLKAVGAPAQTLHRLKLLLPSRPHRLTQAPKQAIHPRPGRTPTRAPISQPLLRPVPIGRAQAADGAHKAAGAQLAEEHGTVRDLILPRHPRAQARARTRPLQLPPSLRQPAMRAQQQRRVRRCIARHLRTLPSIRCHLLWLADTMSRAMVRRECTSLRPGTGPMEACMPRVHLRRATTRSNLLRCITLARPMALRARDRTAQSEGCRCWERRVRVEGAVVRAPRDRR